MTKGEGYLGVFQREYIGNDRASEGERKSQRKVLRGEQCLGEGTFIAIDNEGWDARVS